MLPDNTSNICMHPPCLDTANTSASTGQSHLNKRCISNITLYRQRIECFLASLSGWQCKKPADEKLTRHDSLMLVCSQFVGVVSGLNNVSLKPLLLAQHSLTQRTRQQEVWSSHGMDGCAFVRLAPERGRERKRVERVDPQRRQALWACRSLQQLSTMLTMCAPLERRTRQAHWAHPPLQGARVQAECFVGCFVGCSMLCVWRPVVGAKRACALTQRESVCARVMAAKSAKATVTH